MDNPQYSLGGVAYLCGLHLHLIRMGIAVGLFQAFMPMEAKGLAVKDNGGKNPFMQWQLFFLRPVSAVKSSAKLIEQTVFR